MQRLADLVLARGGNVNRILSVLRMPATSTSTS